MDGDHRSRKYLIVPADDTISENPILMEEFVRMLNVALNDEGIRVVDVDDAADAVLFFRYSIDNGRTMTQSATLPVYGQTGVASAYTYGNVTTFQPSYGVVGSMSATGSEVVYTSQLQLVAIELVDPTQDLLGQPLWQTDVYCVDTYPDLRNAFPYLLAASKEWLGIDTQRTMKYSFVRDEPRISIFYDPDTLVDPYESIRSFRDTRR